MVKKTSKSRNLHKIIGLTLCIPMLAWAATGLVFFTKPGYEEAYAQLPLKTYPLTENITLPTENHWREVRLIHSILGEHLLVKANDGKLHHINPHTLQRKTEPSETDMRSLIDDAIAHNPERYGTIENIDGLIAHTDTGVKITVDWDRLSLQQYGRDRQIIETLYKIHYLQWTPWGVVNRALGILGLALLSMLTLIGIHVYFKT